MRERPRPLVPNEGRAEKLRGILEQLRASEEVDPAGRFGLYRAIHRNYWAAVPIRGEPFAYSIGMNLHYDEPEVMVISEKLEPLQFAQIINEVSCYVRDQASIELGRDYAAEILEKRDLALALRPDGTLEAGEGAKFRLAGVEGKLVFREHSGELADRFPCGFLEELAFVLRMETRVIVADLRG